MRLCLNCGYQNPEELLICMNCASQLGHTCLSCGAYIPLENNFCGQCGERIQTPISSNAHQPDASDIRRASHENMLQNLRARMPTSLTDKIKQLAPDMAGQRREVTVLFVDIAQFTTASRRLDSEDIYLALDEMMHLLADVIYKFEGTIDKFTGDGLMALFGIPINHENDPERAVRSALEMQSVLKPLQFRLNEQLDFDFDIRIGINTGLVIAGSLGSEQHLEYTVIGDTVNLASRLESAAEPGTVLVSFSTYQRTRPIINYKPLPPLELKGWDERVRVYRPLSIRLKPGHVRGLPGLQVPMVGRRENFLKLHHGLDLVRQKGTSQIILCSGEAGMGKTRLVAEFRNSLAEQSVDVFLGTCASYMRTTPYRVISDVIRNILNLSEMDSENLHRETLQKHLEGLGIEYREILPYLLSVLGFAQSDPILDARLQLLDPSMLQRQTHDALRSFFVIHAQKTPIILIFDDLHWVDQASKDFLVHLCQTLEDIPILLILIARNFSRHSFTQSLHDAIIKQAKQPIEIFVEPLSIEDSRLLVDQLIQESTKTAGSIKHQIVERAGGNPYYTEEMVRILIDRGGIAYQDGVWVITTQADELMSDIPGTLQDIILARFDRLVEPLRQTLQRAAVIGRTFTNSLLSMVSDEEPYILSEQLIELEARDFLIGVKLGIEQGYIFKHPLLREAVYNTLLKRDLRNLHYRIARSIQASVHWLPGEKNEILAYHFKESSDPSESIPYLIASAEKASQRFANEAVVQHYRQALALMDQESMQASLQYRKAQVGLAQALKYTGEFEEATNIFDGLLEDLLEPAQPISLDGESKVDLLLESIRELADIRAREGNLDLAHELLQRGLDALGETGQEKYPVHWRRLIDRAAWVTFRQGKLEEAFYMADLALFNSESWEDEDPITLASLYNTLGGVYWTRSRHIEAIGSVERSLDIYKDMNYHWGMAIAYTNLGVLNFSLGRWSDSVAHLEQADVLRREHGYTPERPTNLINLGEVLMCMGDHEKAREKMEASREISLRLGMDIAALYAEVGLSRLATIETNLDQATIHLENAVQLFESSKSESDERKVKILIQQALIECRRGNYSTAVESALQANRMADISGFAWERIEALRILGMSYSGMGNFDQAKLFLKESLELAQTQGDQYQSAQALLETSQMYLAWAETQIPDQDSKLALAQDAIHRSIELFEILGAKFDLHQARKMRNQIVMLHKPISKPGATENEPVQQARVKLGLPEGEWYQAAILYLKLSPRPGEDPELVFETTALLTPPLLDIIRENGGQVTQHPQAMTVVFGAPITHEDDPERAVDSAMKLTNFYHEFHSQTELPISLSIGITMGRVVAGRVGPEQDAEFIVAGEPSVEARLISDVTPLSKVWVTEAVRNATQHRFEYSSVPSDLVTNLTASNVFQFEGVREQIKPVRGLVGLRTPFVGRQTEIAAMESMHRNLERGVGGLIWLEGIPGIGKSRLMREYADHLTPEEFYVWRGACSARRSDYAFYLFSDLLSNAFDLQPTFPAVKIYELIDKKLQKWPEELKETRPYLQILVGVQPLGEQGEQLADLEPEQLRRQTFVALRKVIVALAKEKPLVMLLDDLQWLDLISADLLLFLTNLVVSHPVLIVSARRSIEAGVADEILKRARQIYPEHSIHLSIQPLSTHHCYKLLDQFFESTKLPVYINDLIVKQSGGNPYYIEEFIRMLVEKDYLRVIGGKLEVNQALEFDTLSIPSSLETLIRARVDALQTPARRLLQVSSIIGQRFSEKLLEKISGQDDIRNRLDFLQVRGMLSRTHEADFWEFSHPLIETIVYNTVLKAERRILHRRTALALEDQWRGDEVEHAEDLAYHFGRAEVNDKALYYLILAGERAAARYANEAAIKYFEEGVSLLASLPETNDDLRWRLATGLGEVHQFVGNFEASILALTSEIERLDDTHLSPTQRAGLYRRLGETLLKKGEHAESIDYFNRAIQMIGTLDNLKAGSQTEAALILERMGWNYFTQAELEKAREIGLQAKSFAQQSGSLRALARCENLLGGVFYRQGELNQAMHHTTEAMKYWEQMGYSSGVAGSLNNLGILEVSLGHWDNALDYFTQSLKLRREMGDINGVAMNYNNLGTLAREKGEMALAESYFRDCLAVARPFQLAWHTANATMGVAQALLYQGKLKEAQEMLQDGLAQAEEISARDLSSEMGRTQAEIYIARREYHYAFEAAQQAASLAGEIGNRLMEAGAWRVAADSLLRNGKPQEAKKTLQKAWVAISEAEDELENGRIHAQAGAIHLAMEDEPGALRHYKVAEEIFDRLGAARDLSLLGTLSD